MSSHDTLQTTIQCYQRIYEDKATIAEQQRQYYIAIQSPDFRPRSILMRPRSKNQ